jgi:hypothetical protein
VRLQSRPARISRSVLALLLAQHSLVLAAPSTPAVPGAKAPNPAKPAAAAAPAPSARVNAPSASAPPASPPSAVANSPAPASAAAVVAPPAPPALSDSLTGVAKADYEAARILYDDGDFNGALEKLKSAYELSKDPRLLWNMAACQKNLRHYSEVVTLVDRYLKVGAGFIADSERSDAVALLETMRAFVCELSVSTDAGATVYVDERPLGTAPFAGPLLVDMGPRKIRISKTGFSDYVASPDLPGGSPVTISVQLSAENHRGRLRVVAEPADVIGIDGKTVATGLWEGLLASGTHAVFVSANGKVAYRTEVVVSDNQVNALHVSLQDEPKQALVEKSGVPAWVWVAGSVLLVGGGLGTYLLLKPSGAKYESGQDGSWGSFSL